MYIYAALLAGLLFFPLTSWQSLWVLFWEGAEEQGGTEQQWMRVKSYLSEVWAELSQGEESVEQPWFQQGDSSSSCAMGVYYSGSLTVWFPFTYRLCWISQVSEFGGPIYWAAQSSHLHRNLASNVSLASLILASEPLKLCAGISTLILLTFCGGGE